MRKLFVFLIVRIPVCAQQQGGASKVVAIKVGKLIDVVSGKVFEKQVILIEGERITAIGPELVIPKDAEVIDLSSSTVLPGLIDVHTHLLQNYKGSIGGDDPNIILTVTQLGTTRRALLGAKMGLEDLQAGITTVRPRQFWMER